ncbi:MAG: hypothetical protein HY716_09960 [Planctomycetes bacterium]|nr:hypothetical protein [Planctomycetota bacterium]
MSTLSKLFVVLVFMVAMVKLGIDATLFSQRVDWKDKFVKEANYHHQSLQIKSAEISDLALQIDNLKSYNDILKTKVENLDVERSSLATTIADLTRRYDDVQKEKDTMQSNLAVLARQLEVQLTQVQQMTEAIENYRVRIAKSNMEKATATTELQYIRQQNEQLWKDLGSLEENHQNLAREKQKLQDVIAHLNSMGVRTDVVAPRKILSGKVTAVSNEIGLVIISIGRDDGVMESDEFTVYRMSNFVAKIVIDRVDSKWSAGRVVLKKEDPRIADDVSNNVLASPFKGGGQ